MPLQVPQHSHCVICGKAVQAEEKTCGPECVKALEQHNKKRRLMMLLMYGLIGFTVVLLFFGTGRQL